MHWGEDKNFTFPSCRSLILVNKIKILISKDTLSSPQRGSGSHREFLVRTLFQVFCATLQGRRERIVSDTLCSMRGVDVPWWPQVFSAGGWLGALLTGCYAQMEREVPVSTCCCVLSVPELLQKAWWVGTSCEPNTWTGSHQFTAIFSLGYQSILSLLLRFLC